MMSLAAYNNETNRSYVAVAAMFLCNTVFNLILAGPLGLFGIGLASSVSGFVSFLIMLPANMKNHTICFAKGPFNLPLVGQTAWRGLPCLLFIAGVTIKNMLFIITPLRTPFCQWSILNGSIGSLTVPSGTKPGTGGTSLILIMATGISGIIK